MPFHIRHIQRRSLSLYHGSLLRRPVRALARLSPARELAADEAATPRDTDGHHTRSPPGATDV